MAKFDHDFRKDPQVHIAMFSANYTGATGKQVRTGLIDSNILFLHAASIFLITESKGKLKVEMDQRIGNC